MKHLMQALYIVAVTLIAAGSPAADSVVARVNGTAIGSTDLDMAVNAKIPKVSFHGGVSEETRAEIREQALEELIERELQYQDAVAKGIKPDKKQVKVRMEEARSRFASKSEYKAALEKTGMTEDQLRSLIERDLAIQAVIEKVTIEPVRFPEKELKEYYEKNISKFVRPESVKLRVISTKEEKKSREAHALVKSGNDFGNIAARMSEDDYRIKGGDIGYIHKGRILPSLENAAFRMKVGEVSDPMQAEGKWYIVKVEEKRAEYQAPFEEIRDQLRKDLEKKQTSDLRVKWVSELKAKAKIEILKTTDKIQSDQ